MKKNVMSVVCAVVLSCTVITGCGDGASAGSTAGASAAVSSSAVSSSVVSSSEEASEVSLKNDEELAEKKTAEEPTEEKTAEEPAAEKTGMVLEDGVYSAEFDTDSSMFHVNEANGKRGILTVADGKMTIHVSLASKNIVSLFVGTAEDAKKEGADILQPTSDTVTYSDGISEEVYGFDIPVPALDEEYSVALLGTKDKWYDHKVSVTDPQPQ